MAQCLFCSCTFCVEWMYALYSQVLKIIHQKSLLQKTKNGVRWMFKTLRAWTVGSFRIFTVLLSMQSITFTGCKCFQGWSVDEHHLQKYMWTWFFNDLLSFSSLWPFSPFHHTVFKKASVWLSGHTFSLLGRAACCCHTCGRLTHCMMKHCLWLHYTLG